MVAVAVVALVTVTGPNWPSAVFVVFPTVIPEPNLAWVTPWTKLVFLAVMATVTTSPACAVFGVIAVILFAERLTIALADFVRSTALAATTLTICAVGIEAGAVYTPLFVMLPSP